MPLYANALAQIRANLEALGRGEKVPAVTVGQLTDEQVKAINESRASARLPQPPISGEVYFIGRHIYERRVVANGYSIDEVLIQIESSMSAESRLIPTHRSTVLQNHTGRRDCNGKIVQDEVVLECTARNPRAQIYSVIPKGDGKGGD